MRAVARWVLAAVLVGGISTAGRADDAPLTRADLDKRIGVLVYEATAEGVALYNGGKPEECFRLYQGSLTAINAFLDHKPKLMASVKEKLLTAKGQKVVDGAFTLRKALDEIQADVSGVGGGMMMPGGKKSLWERLGGEASVKLVVHDFVGTTAGNPKVNFFRDGKFPLSPAGVERLEKLLVELISANTGGPLKYTGKGMKESHAGMKIKESEFNALAGDMVATLMKYKVPQAGIDELVGIIATTKKDIVEDGAAAGDPAAAMPKKVLWERLGGEAAVKLVVHDFVGAAATNPKVNFFRDGKFPLDAAGVTKLEKLLVELISQTTGGPLKYTGKGMKESHAGMKIKESEFNALAGDLVATLKKYKVPQTEIDELVTIIGSTKDAIVEDK